MANVSHINIDSVDIGPDSGVGYGLIDEGNYLAKVIDSKLVPTKGTYTKQAGARPEPKGYVLELTWQILSGPFERRLVWDKITLIHISEQAQEIGRKQWKLALRAAGIDPSPQDSSEIHNKLVKIHIKTKPASKGFEAQNAVSAYYPAPKQADMAPAAPQGQAQKAAGGAQQPKQPTPPWGSSPGDAAPF